MDPIATTTTEEEEDEKEMPKEALFSYDSDEEFYSDMDELRHNNNNTMRNDSTADTDDCNTNGINNNNNINRSMMISMETTRMYAIQALALTVQEWNSMGQGSDPTIAERALFAAATKTSSSTLCQIDSSTENDNKNDDNNENDDDNTAAILKVCVQRVTSLLLVRIVAIALHRRHIYKQQQQQSNGGNTTTSARKQRTKKPPKPLDISTSGICRQALLVDTTDTNNNTATTTCNYDIDNVTAWSGMISQTVVQQLEQYVACMLQQYSSVLPFHNRQHAVTVVTNVNKLIDVMIDPCNVTTTTTSTMNNNHTHSNKYTNGSTSQYLPPSQQQQQQQQQQRHCCPTTTTTKVIPTPTFGLRNDPLLLFAVLFAALIHDVCHEGKLNSQLVAATGNKNTSGSCGQCNQPPPPQQQQEYYPNHSNVALLYNDQSIQEMRSLNVAFTELLKSEYSDLRNILFCCDVQTVTPNTTTSTTYDESYRFFRTVVISAVLSTDLSSPERMAVSRSKWKEAFARDNTKNNHKQEQRQQQPANNINKHNQQYQRRASATSNASNKPRNVQRQNGNVMMYRRGSNYSEMSEITTDEGCSEPMIIPEFVRSNNTTQRRNSVTSETSSTYHPKRYTNATTTNSSVKGGGGGGGQLPPVLYRQSRRRSSTHSDLSSDCDDSSEVAVDSVALMYNKQQQKNIPTTNRTAATAAGVANCEEEDDSILSDTIDSYVLRTTKVLKVKRELESSNTRQRPNIREVNKSTIETSISGDLIVPVADDADAVNALKPHATAVVPRALSIGTSGNCTDGSTSFVSYPAGSIAVIHKRLDGGPKTRRRAASEAALLEINADDDDDDDDIVDRNDRYLNISTEAADKYEYASTRTQTPPSSDDDDDDDEYEKQRTDIYSSPPQRQVNKPLFPPTKYNNNNHINTVAVGATNVTSSTINPVRMIARRASTGAISRFGSLTDQRIDENHSNHGHHDEESIPDSNKNAAIKNSIDLDVLEIPKYRKRLGLRRSMDLSGEAIEFYLKRSSIGNVSTYSGSDFQQQYDGTNHDQFDTEDESDHIKASAVIEALLRMADVGHFYQNWHSMTDWSKRMFQERMFAEPSADKQHEIYTSWFNNQILIIDSYLKPLAIQLDEAGIFGAYNGTMFGQNVDEIRRHWMMEGYEWSQKLK